MQKLDVQKHAYGTLEHELPATYCDVLLDLRSSGANRCLSAQQKYQKSFEPIRSKKERAKCITMGTENTYMKTTHEANVRRNENCTMDRRRD